MARSTRRPTPKPVPKASSARPGAASRGGASAHPAPAAPTATPAHREQGSNRAPRAGQASARGDRNMMEDFAGIDEMGGKRRPVSRRLQLSEDDLTDERGLTLGRQRNVPKTVANAALPPGNALELDDDLSRDLPKLPGDSGTRKTDLQWAARSSQQESLDIGPTSDNPQGRNRDGGSGAIETLPVGHHAPQDSGIMRMRLNASAVLSAVDYNDEMRGSTVEEAQRRSKSSAANRPAPKSASARTSGKRGRRSRRGGKPAASAARAAAKPAAQPAAKAASASRRGKAESRGGSAEPARASRRSKASRAASGKGDSSAMMMYGAIGGVVLLLLVVAIFAFSSGSSRNKGSGKAGTQYDSAPDESPVGLKQRAEALATGSEADRLQARDLFLRAVPLFDANGDSNSADDCQRKADGLHKDAKLNFYPGKK